VQTAPNPSPTPTQARRFGAASAALIALTLGACAPAPEPLIDYDAPYLGGKGDTLVRPMPRPERIAQRRWLACPNAITHDDCGNGGLTNAPAGVVEPDPVDGPDLDVGGDRPDEPVPELPDPVTPPTPEPPAPEPEPEPEEPHEPPPETHEPPPVEECPA
jgi:hypothetical protein